MSKTFYWHDYETFGTDPSRDRAVQFAGLRTEAHAPTEIGVFVPGFHGAISIQPFGNQSDNRVWCFWIEFRTMSLGQTQDITRVFDNGNLHTETNAEIRDIVGTRIAGCSNFALDTATAEAPGDENGIQFPECIDTVTFNGIRVDFDDIDFGSCVNAGMGERFIE